MLQRFKSDARKISLRLKKAVFMGDLLGDEEDDARKDEETGELQKGEELTPVKPLPGTPKGMHGEVEEDYEPMSAAEIEEVRKEQGESKSESKPESESEKGEQKESLPPSFRNIMKDLLKEETPEGKKEQAMQLKYGPPEVIKDVVDTLEQFQGQLSETDLETAQAAVMRSSLPDILKERAQTLFDSDSAGDSIRSMQLALNLLGAKTKKESQDAEDWLRDTEAGRSYMTKVSEMHRVRRVMNMLSNTLLSMEGQSVIDQPRKTPGGSKDQRNEKARIQELFDALQSNKISNLEFEDAKRNGQDLSALMTEKAKPAKETLQQKVEREYREEERKKRNSGIHLNMRKISEGDVTGPGGDSWEYEWTSGPTPTKDEPQKRKHRFPFRNKPSTYTPGEGDQGNLFDIDSRGGEPDMNHLAGVIESMRKTADNDMFSIHSLDNGEKWLTYTLFKRAYSKFRPGDIVVQYGKTSADYRTYRRRFGSVIRAKKLLVSALSPGLATTVSEPTSGDSFHGQQKGEGEPGGVYGPHTTPYDKQPWQGNRDGFDAKNTPRTRTKRKFIPYMDTADDEGTGFIGGRTAEDSKKEKKADFNPAAPVTETPEERAAVIEQPPIKPINKDQKRPINPKKRYDKPEQNLLNPSEYSGEDSNGWSRERILLSVKKLPMLNMKTAAITYEVLQKGLNAGQITQEEFNQMVEYYQLAPPAQAESEVHIPENFIQQDTVNEWTPDIEESSQEQERGRLFFGKKKNK